MGTDGLEPSYFFCFAMLHGIILRFPQLILFKTFFTDCFLTRTIIAAIMKRAYQFAFFCVSALN